MRLEIGEECSPTLDYCVAMDRLNSFPKYALDGGKNKWIRAASEGQTNEDFENIAIRSAEINNFWFTNKERMEVAMLIIHRHDLNFKFHCETVMCGDECEYAVVQCENENCATDLSRKWVSKHDTICVHKKVSCTRSCGEIIPRRLMDTHLSNDCDLRPAVCTFADIGCEAGTLCVYSRLFNTLICDFTALF